MKTDLKNLVVSQEVYFSDHNTYARAIGAEPAAGVAFLPLTPGNTLVLSNVTARGWTGVMTNRTLASGTLTCGVYVGPAGNSPNEAVNPTLTTGLTTCWSK